MKDARLVNNSFEYNVEHYDPSEKIDAVCKFCRKDYSIRLDRLKNYKCTNNMCPSVYTSKTVKYRLEYNLTGNQWDNWFYYGLRIKSIYNCDIHGEQEVSLDMIKRGLYCKECSSNNPYTTKTMIDKLNKIYKGKLDFSNSVYKGTHNKIDFYCKIHKTQSIRLDGLLAGVGCAKCNTSKQSIKMKKTINDRGYKYIFGRNLVYDNDSILKLLHKVDKGYKLLSDFKGVKENIDIMCGKGHKYTTRGERITQGHGFCKKCHNIGTSKMEEELASFISQYIVIERHINPFEDKREIDIHIPEHNLFIEFDGVYWHSDKFKGTVYQRDKTLDSLALGKSIIHITDSQWIHNKYIVQSLILNKLNLTPFKIGARKCNIKELSSQTAKMFMDDNHLQGYAISSVKLGLYFEEELLSVMTFSISKKGEYNLNRFATKTFTNVQGGFSKLLRYFTKNRTYDNIISFADLQGSQGAVYLQHGFKEIYTTSPSYNYYDSAYNMYHKSYFRKARLKQLMSEKGLDFKDKTEFQMSDELGFIRYYDSGKIKYNLTR